MEANAVAIRSHGELAPSEWSIEQMTHQVQKIQALMKELMHKDEHYGVIPGTNKPTLLKPGAEKLCLMFRLAPKYQVLTDHQGDHLTVISTCELYHINTGALWGTGMGSCSTKESKYAYRKMGRVCPQCGKDTLMHTKKNPEDWWCNKYKDGCGTGFKKDDARITEQQVGRVDNPDKADQYNTVLKMANKRSLVAAVLNATAASDIFTQDLEDRREGTETDDGYGADESGEHKVQAPHQPEPPKPTDPASTEKRKQVMGAAKRRYGDTAGKQWLKAELERREVKDEKQFTFGIASEILKTLIEGGASADDPQIPLGNTEPIADEKDIEY